MSGAYTVKWRASSGIMNRQENEYPSSPWSKMSAGPDPARRYRTRAPSSSIQHSSTPASAGGRASVETPRDRFITTKSYSPKDNSFPTAGVYLKEHRLCSFHLGELRLPAFWWKPFRSVILSEADGS